MSERPVEAAYPLSPVQEGILFHSLYAPEEGLYVVQLSCDLRGELDGSAFERAWQAVVDRHAILRTGFTWKSGARPLQVVGRRVGVPVRVEDWREVSALEREARFASFLAEDRVRGFKLNRAPLLRVALLRMGDREHRFVWTFHHLLLDGWSYALVLAEVFQTYQALRRSAEPRLGPVRPYRAFIDWLQARDRTADEAFWRERLRGVDAAERSIANIAGGSGGPAFLARETELTPAATADLERAARRHRMTMSTLVQGALALWLGRSTGRDEVVFGAVASGRPPELAGVESIVGMFVNTLPVRVPVSGEDRVGAWLEALQRQQSEVRLHENSSLVDLQAWSGLPAGEPLFEAVVIFENYPVSSALDPAALGLEVGTLRSEIRSNYPLNLAVTPGERLKLRISCSGARFDAPAVDRMLGHLERLLAGLATVAEAPDRMLGSLSPLSEPECHQLLWEWDDTAAEVEAGTMVDRFLAQAEQTPDTEAVVAGEAAITYGELARRSGELARHLSGLGVGPEVKVGLCLERAPDLAVGLLGIWRSGGAYVPLDPSYPDARLALLLEDSGAAVVVTEERWRGRLEALADVRLVCVESLGKESRPRGPERRPLPEDLAYLIYTSGTTGRPKAVMVEHGSLANLLDGRDFRAGDRMPCLAAYTFDIFLFELLSPLLAGGTSVLYGLRPTLDVESVAADLGEMTHLHAVPAVMRQIVDLAGDAPQLRELFVGGDLVPSDLLMAMRERFPAARVRVLYGPTEATILATSHSAEGPGSVIGRPLDNVRLRLSDRFGSPVPVGIAGEIWIGGPGVSRGYLGQEDLTREKFVEADGGRWYRTGDLGRWLPDGRVEFLGRSDDQVKVRGFRIELAEVESVMARHPGVRAAAAAVRAGRLVGWFVPAGEIAAGDLRAFLESELPAPLVPSSLVELESLPLTPHGKVDRRSLPDPERTGTAEPVAPRTPVEEVLAGIWAGLLGHERVGVHDSFFELGGHSLLATQLVSRVREVFEVEVPLAWLFEAPTVAELAVAVTARQGAVAAPPLEVVDRSRDLPLSFAQERIWFFEQLEPGTPTYNLPLALRLDGEVDAAALAGIFGAIVERHEALRTVFVNPGGEPLQRVEPPAPPAQWPLPVIDLGSGSLESLAAEEASRPFDLGRGPLLRTTLVRLGEREHVLLLTLHHIAADAWSMGVLVEEVKKLWSGAALRPLPVQYGDYAVWQRFWLQGGLQGETLERLVSYWRGHLAGAPTLLELPTDRPRPAVQSFRGAACTLELGERASEGLRVLARGRSATLFMVLLAGFETLLGRLSDREDVVVGTPIAGRVRRELEDLIGFFVNTLALRGDLSGDPTFEQLVGRVRRAALGGYEHQDLPFEKLVEELQPERSLGHAPLFQAMFVLQNAPLGPVEVPGVRLRAERTGTVAAEHDWTLEAWDVEGRIRTSLQYRTDLFDEATIRRALDHLETLLESAVEDPRRKVGDLPLLRPVERQQIVCEWGDGGAAGSGEVPVHERIAALAVERPEAPAVIFADGVLSFEELAKRSRRLALELNGLGVGPESVVALCVERSPEMAIGILGVLAAGGAYLPLDPSYPKDRLAFLLEDSGASVVLTQHRLLGALPASGPVRLCLDEARPVPLPRTMPPVLPDQAAYVIYTSGSTGRPKGAVVSHRSLSVYTETLARELDLGPDDRMLQFASPAFDVVVEELFPAWSSGAAVVLRDSEALSTGAGLRQVLAEDGVTVCELPTAFWHEWVYELSRTGEPLPESLRLVLIGGEHVLPERLSAWSHFDVPLVHVYGLTETTVTSTTWPVPAGWTPPSEGFVLPIGHPLPGTRVLVLDRGLQPVPTGVAGELYLGGSGLARGYVGRPGLTAERFVPSAVNGGAGSRLYRTGDLARWRADGTLEFLGRLDHQVKVRGFRVEPGEIEAVLARHPAVREVSVVARPGKDGTRRLVAYVALAQDTEEGALVQDLRQYARGPLPDYMVPSAFVVLPALPRTATGKLDRRALPEPVEGVGPGEATEARPRTATEEILAGIWSEVLGLERVGVREDFFALGGHSLLATRVISRLRETFGVEMPLRSLFEHSTVESLAAAVDASRRSGLRTEMPAIVPVPRAQALPLSFAQQRLWFLDQLDPGNPAYNVPVALRLRGDLDVAALARTLSGIARRHEVLRTRFAVEDGRAVAMVEPFSPVPLPVVDLSGVEWRETVASALVKQEAGRRFDLERGPLMRACLVRLGPDDHLALFSTHHIVSDAWSMDVLVREVASLYGGSPLPDLPVQYADYAVWQRSWLQGETLEAHLAWWRNRLAGASPVLDLPTDRPRPAVQSFRGASHAFELPDLAEPLRAFARREGVTLFMALLAAFQALLHRVTGQDDLSLGTPVAGREHLRTEDLIGFFVNTLVLRARIDREAAVLTLLREVRENVLEAFVHQDLPLDLLVEALRPERDLSWQPLFQAVFAFEQGGAKPPELPGLVLEPLAIPGGTAKFDLSLTVVDHDERAALRAAFVYAEELFDATTLARLGGHLESVIRCLVEAPSTTVAALPLLSEPERHQILWEWSDTAAEVEAGTVVDRFLAQAERTPDAEAVTSLKYEELARRSGELARHLSGLGVGPEVRVGLCLERTPDLAVALLGIWRAGGAYVPLDPSYPDARLALLLEDSGATVVVTEERWRGRLEALADVRLVCVEALGEERGPERRPAPEDLAYLIYTSGTTGRPKAVMVEHGSLANLLDGRDFRAGDRMPCLAAYTFDIFLFELLSPLLAGGTSVLYGLRPTLDVESVVADLGEMTHLHAVPAVMRQIVDLAGDAPRLRELFVGGDLVPSDLLAAMRERFPAARVRVLYGPTEGTILATSHGSGGAGSVLGRPLANVRLRLSDRSGSPVPIGVAGEIWIGGAGVSRGYLGQEELTRERFVEADGGRWYRTGDLGRWLPDGAVQFLGRSDDQVKVRGFRIELAEVESVMGRHPGVRAAAAAVRSGRLVGWFVPADETSTVDLRSFLESQLPAPLVPSSLVELASLPLTPHGKVDRRALPDPEQTGTAEPVAPRTPVEEVLAGIWSDLLGCSRVGVHDSFFDLGGHSLLATQLISRVREAFEVELPLARLFEAPTVAGLAAAVASQQGVAAAPPLETVDRGGDLPLSFAQERIWFFEQLEPGTPTYHLPLALRLEGEVDAAALAGIFGAIVERHEALRTVFVNPGGEPLQRVEPPAPWQLPVVSGSLASLAAEEARRPFDLGRGPLLRTTLVRLGEREHVLLLTLHHIASDAWSMGVLLEEVQRLWSGAVLPALPPLPVQYGDYAVWQRRWLQGETLERLVAYWRGHLAGAPALLELPADRPRPAVQSFQGAACTLELGERVSESLRALARGRSATLFMVLLAGFEALLGRLSGQEDLVVGTPIAGRTRRELEALIGFFVNTLALRGDLSGDPTFEQLVGRVRRAALAGYEHQDLPFEKLVEELQPERSLGHAPLFQAMFVLQNAPLGSVEVPGVRLRAERTGTVAAEHDWTLETWDVEGRIRASLQYRTDLFDEATIRRALGHLEMLLESAVEDPRRKVWDLPLLRPLEQQQIVSEWGDGGAAGSGEVPVHERIAALAAERPEAPAVVFADGALSFGELMKRSRRLSHELRGLGVGAESVVALCVERSPQMAIGILGVLSAGGAYLPLDPSYPKDRLAFLLEDSRASVVLTQHRLLGALPADGPALLCLDEERPAPMPTVVPSVLPDQAAYVIYTSGSTGQPKGAVVSHRALSVYTETLSRKLDLGPDDRMLQFASPAFDVVVEELFPAWSSGAAVVLRESEALSTGAGLRQVLAETGVTVCELPTAFWHEWVYELARTGESLPESLRLVLIGGEHVLPERLSAWGRLDVPLVHVYGLTETTVTSTTWSVPAGWTPPSEDFVLPIGRPLPGTRVLVLDRNLRPVPAGVAGELCLGGSGLARGYVGRPDLTAERFVPSDGSRLYRTGDLARWRADGALEFLGRLDQQVKVRGFRVEPGEIEAALAQHPAVREVSVVARMQRLVAYVVLSEGGVEDLRRHLHGSLPDYMVPSAFVVLPALPRTATGKLDRRALPEPVESMSLDDVRPRTATEEILAGIWSEVLGLERVGTREDFFALGGHSLLATRIISRLRETFCVELPLRSLFEHPMVESLAAAVDASLRFGLRTEMPAIVQVPRTQALPLSFAQQRLWFLDQLDPGNPAYNVPVALRLSGELDVAVLARTLSEISRRHEVLRTRFAAEDGRAVAVIEPSVPVSLPILDLDGLERRESVASSLVKEEAERRFDLERGPLMRVCLVRLGPDDHLALFSTHHIVSDAWSMDVLVKEVASLYIGSTLPDLPVQYADYAAWQRSWLQGEVLEEHLAWWRARLAGASPVLDLPTDRPRPPVQSFRGATHAFAIPDDLAAGLRELGRREGTTLFMTLLAGFESLLLRQSLQEDFCVGTPVAGRSLLAVEDLIGFFVNTLVLRADLADCASFRDLLRRCREASLGAFSHAEMPLDRLVEELQPERRADNQPLFQVMFAFETEQEQVLLLPGLTFSPVEVHESRAKFDLTLTFSEARGALGAGFSFACDLFDATTVARMGERLVSLLSALAASPDEAFRTVSLLGEAERHQILAEWNDTAFASGGGTVVERFAAQAARTPDAPAVEAGGSVISYGDLARRSGDLARYLRALGVGPETRVGLCLDRTVDLVVGLLGIWKAGGAYVAMEPSYPDARLALLLEDSAAPVVVTERRWRDRLAAMTEAPLVCADEIEPMDGAGHPPAPRDLAYLIYTSGTTGRPKAVMVEHGSLSNLLDHTGRIFRFGPGDRMPCLAAYTFDIFLFELLSPLLAGGTSVLYGLRPTLDVEAVAAGLGEMTHLHAVPAVMRQIVDLAGEAPRLRELFVGGDLVPPDLLAAMRERFPSARVHVLYGPTEGTILASSHTAERIGQIGQRPVIGRPLGNMVLRLSDKTGAPVPIGIAGEIWIGGAGVSRGYLGQEALTREKFVEADGTRWYRTGDLARWLADGGIEFQGRSDDQVKIRGFRIELAEVESVLAQHPAVRAASAAARGEGEARRLVGWFVAAEGTSAAELREFLEERLPAHMVPSALVELETLPLTPHGKVDRRALPDPERTDEEAGAYVPPRTPTEELLVGIWAEVLKQGRVGVHDNFFDLGGHSLLATQLISRVREAFEVELPLVRIFEAPTVAGLAEVLATGSSSADKAKSDPILPAPRDRVLPLSFSQERVWFFEQLEPGTSAYNLPLALRVEGDLTPVLLSALLEAIALRHEPLRTSFPERNGEPVQEIAPPGEWSVPLIDLTALENRFEVALALGTREAQRPFDLASGPLLRTRLLKLGPDDQILLFNMHHIVSDGWSMGVLMHEFSELYRAFRTGLPPELPALPVQYADYAVWQREWMKGEVLERQLGFWREQLEGAPAILDLPTDRPRPAFMSFRGGTEYFRLDSGRMAALHALARRRGTTMFMVLLAAFDALVGRHTSSGDVVVGSPIANRTRSEVENLIGFFVNTILLRVSVAGDPTFIEILDRVRRATLGAYGHQDLPFEKLVEALQPDRNLGETPLFQIMFVLQNAPAGAAGAEDLKISPIETPGEVAAEFDWTVELVDASEGLLASLQYRRDLFDQTTIQRVARRFEVLLDSLSADPERHLSDLLLLTAAERHQLAAEWNDTEQDEPGTLLVWERIAAWADRLPDAPAVISEGGSLSYRELRDRAERLAAELRGRGVGPEVVVALFLERSPETAVGILGVLAAGGVYVPLDPAYPRDRITFMLEDSGARVVLTQRRLLDVLPADGLTVLCLDEERETVSAGEPVPVHPDNAAYIIYTSGSTGRPKGAVITHRALAVYVEAISRELGLGPEDRMLQFASPGFDVVVEEIFPAWANGAAVVLRESEAFATGEGLLRVIADDGVTACELPTAFWHEWVYELSRAERTLPESLRFVIIGGEHVIPERLAAWSRFGVPLVHVYGLTETTVTSTTWHVPAGWTPPSSEFVLPIGRPIGACRVLIPAPLGVPGELCIAGDCLARGYFGRPDLTAERFAPGPFGERVYRTGDLARHRADGAVEFLGRLDHQVKIRGFRIELGEIEAALGRHPAVREVAVLARKGPDGMPRLVAYLALGAQIGAAELRPYLQELLPEYMIPGVFMPLEALPRTATGKVDRKALPEVDLESGRAYVAPRDPTEELLAVLWTQVLGVERVGVEDDFFGLGGHSLLATRLMARVREAFGVDVPLRSLFESPSLAGLAEEVRSIQRSGSGLAMPPIEPAGRSGPLPLSFAQQRLWFLGQLEPDNPAYSVPIALRVTGDLDVRVFDRTLGEIVRRHESLRTRFGMDGSEPVQVIDPSAPWRTPVVDLGALPADVREREVFRLATDEAQTPFDLARGPLLRVRLLTLAPEERVVLFSMHHIVSDAWSMEVLVGEMAPLYSAFLRGEPSPLPELPIQYADYAVWQRSWLQGEVLEKHLAYWKEQLAGAAQVLELPTDRPRPSFQTFRGATYSFDLPPGLAQALRAVAREESATLFMTLLAPLEWLLSRYSGQQDFCVGTPIAGRNHLETEGLIGFFVNTLVLRADLSRAAGPRDLLRRGREVVLGAFSHQDLPFEKLVEEIQPERDLARHPLFQAVFALETERGEEPAAATPAPISDGLAFAPLEFEGTAAKFDWALSVVDFGERLSVGIDYMADLFDETTIARMAAHYERLTVALAEEPWRALDETPLLAAGELQQVVREWSDTDLAIDAEATVPALFAQAARRWPETVAVDFDGEALTYAELDARSERLARRLAGLGVGPEVRVGLGLDRSVDLIVGLLGIWKAGGAFVPMDPGYPDLRLKFLAEDSGAAFIVTRERWRERLEGLAPVVYLDEAGDEETEPRTARPGDLAYLIYTSGTTGTPKAVLVEHRSLANVLGSAQRLFDFRPGDRMPCLASFSFDIFLFELLNPLLAGGTSVLFGLDPTLDVDRVAASLSGMTHLHAVPAVMWRIAESVRNGAIEAPVLREIFVGGDLVPPDLLDELRQVFPKARVHVLYGPTEATIICSSHEAALGGDRPWIGRPLPNARLLLVGRGGLLVPVGAVGEIWIGGAGVARGYQNREELTAEKFATWDDGERFYRTGDLGRWSATGVLEFLGRLDDQVKIRGFRIEPGEIEAALRQSPQVQDAAVAVWGEGEDRRLAAYFVPAEGVDIPTPDELRDFLRRSLPEHLIPAAFLELPAIPLTPHGKVDRRHLPEPEGFGAVEYVAPKEGIEEILAGIWAELLDVPRVGARDNFFDLGGHSLLATRLASRVREAFGIELPLRAIFENPTVAELAGPIEELVLADIDALSEDEARALLES